MKNIERLNLLLGIVKDIHKYLFREKDRKKLLQGICDILINNHRYCYTAWIALLNESGRLIPIAQAGFGEEFPPIIEQLRNGKLPYCVRKTLIDSKIFITEVPLPVCNDCPLFINQNDRGAMTVRLEYEKKVFGILSISMSTEFIQEEKEHGLLKEIAADIAFVLHNIELEENQKRVKEALFESEKRFRNLVENSFTGILIIQDNQIIYKNPEQERLFSPFPKSFIFTDFKNIHPDDVEKVRKNYESIISKEVPTLSLDFRFYPEGKMDSRLDMKWVYCKASRIKYNNKDAILFNMMDITRAKELERLLTIQDKMTSLGRLAMEIAHEIRNPLSGINIYLSTLEKIFDRGDNLEQIKEILRHLQSASSKIESAIKRIMNFSKSNEPKFILTDINKAIEEAVILSLPTLKKNGIKIEKSLAGDLPLCYIDQNLITEVVLNLIINAAEAMLNIHGDKVIEIDGSIDENHIIVSVSDSGPGVPPNLRNILFDPFFSTKHGSTGIGLSICHRIITDHGGSLNIFKSKLGGAEFVFKIPLKKQTRME
ncbi:MAG: two-component system sensor histidine kinase NtrB [bacterium]